MKKSRIKRKNYYCDGICEHCEKGKFYEDKYGDGLGYYSCDKNKIKGLYVIAPQPM